MMKAISIRAPWSFFIIFGGKNIENRGVRTPYRGPILLHQSKWFVESEVKADFEFAAGIARASGVVLPPVTMAQIKVGCGCLVGRATVVDCVGSSPSPWFFGAWGYVLDDVQPLAEPIPFKGQLGLFDVLGVPGVAP